MTQPILEPLGRISLGLARLGRRSTLLPTSEDSIGMVLAAVESSPDLVAEILFLDDVELALGQVPANCVVLQVLVRTPLALSKESEDAVIAACNEVNQSLSRVFILPDPATKSLFLRGLIPWPDRDVDVELIEKLLVTVDDLAKHVLPVLYQLGNRSVSLEQAIEEFRRFGFVSKGMSQRPGASEKSK